MKYTNYRLFVIALFIITLVFIIIPSQADAAYRRRSSTLQRAIDALDNDPVEDIPNPILLGKYASNFTDTWGEARASGRTHEGTDIFAPRGAFIVSPTDAVVTSAEASSTTNTLGGTYVYTANPGNEKFYYAHLDKIADGIKSGKILKKGDIIGYVGNTGNAAGGATHLHFGISTNREAVNPFPRLTTEFTMQEKMDNLEKILDDEDKPEILATSLALKYKSMFLSAGNQGISIPKEVAIAINTLYGNATTSVSSGIIVSGIPERDLTIGLQGGDVKWLQEFLIDADQGIASTALANVGATGYFGTITKNSLIEYQVSVGISPASGYFGPITRAHLRTIEALI